ncbi:conserved hypothetical protein [Burkholderia vietnamiensis]|nr:conserved hypothetical protein [Burkholderia vietnamiensis]
MHSRDALRAAARISFTCRPAVRTLACAAADRSCRPSTTEGAQMNADDSSRLPLAGAALRIGSARAVAAPASVSPFSDPQPIARVATRREAFARR